MRSTCENTLLESILNLENYDEIATRFQIGFSAFCEEKQSEAAERILRLELGTESNARLKDSVTEGISEEDIIEKSHLYTRIEVDKALAEQE
ncbi:MAG: hypothetical protein AAGI66_08545 [Cyanobacteria bacterium P01_H01_bin.74]